MSLESHEFLYHLALAKFWPPMPGEDYKQSTVESTLAQEGYIHLSRASQVPYVARKFYHGRDDVIMLTIDPELLDSEVKFEDSDDHELSFPHLYGPLSPRAVIHTDRLIPDAQGNLIVAQLLPG